MADYICLGLSTLDYIWSVPSAPVPGSKVFADRVDIEGGGMAATAAVAISRLGGEVAFWGRAGNDASGSTMRSLLESEGVDVTEFRLFDNAQSPVASVVVDQSGERQISTFRGSGLPENAEWLPMSELQGARAVLADMRWVVGAITLFDAARQQGIPTVLDADIAAKHDFENILGLTDYALFSESGLAALQGDGDADDPNRLFNSLLEQGCRAVGVTRGGRGTDWVDATGTHHMPAFSVDVIDTTGAGDVFHGAFALAIGEGNSVIDSIRHATAAAALKCEALGGRKGIPTAERLSEFLSNRP